MWNKDSFQLAGANAVTSNYEFSQEVQAFDDSLWVEESNEDKNERSTYTNSDFERTQYTSNNASGRRGFRNESRSSQGYGSYQERQKKTFDKSGKQYQKRSDTWKERSGVWKEVSDGQEERTDGQKERTNGWREKTGGWREKSDGWKERADGRRERERADGRKERFGGRKERSDGWKDQSDGWKERSEIWSEKSDTSNERSDVWNESYNVRKERSDARKESSSNWRNRDNELDTCDSPLIMTIPACDTGKVIGKKGAQIRNFRDKTGANIQVCGPSDDSEETIIEIKGAKDAQLKAKNMIQDFLSGFKENNKGYGPPKIWNNTSQKWNNTPQKWDASEKSQQNLSTDEDKEPVNWAELIARSAEEKKKRWENLPDIKKCFYIEDPGVKNMSSSEVDAFRKANNNIVVCKLDEDNDIEVANPVTNFHQAFKYYPEILDEIAKQGFEKPSPIQCQAWPILLQGHDLIGIAQTGTGKTLAFLLPAFIHIDKQPVPREERLGPSCLVLAPTRELAQQIERETKKYTYKDIKCVCIYGGGSRRDQINTVAKGVEIVIATPGRLNDLVMNKILDVTSVTYLILDEADRMLDLGFEPQIKKVLLDIRPDRQTVMTSATWPEGVRKLADQYMTKPIQVFIGTLDLSAVHSVTQEVLIVSEEEKRDMVYDFISKMQPEDKVIIFVDKKIVADDLASDFILNGIECQSIHGDREQCDREQALEDLRTGLVSILVATDVASRGLDIKDITHIFNYNFPRNVEEYVHRVGRTGRAGRSGASITLLTRSDWKQAKDLINIMEEAGQEIPEELYSMAERYAAWKERKDAEDNSVRGGRKKFGRNRRDQNGFFDYD